MKITAVTLVFFKSYAGFKRYDLNKLKKTADNHKIALKRFKNMNF